MLQGGEDENKKGPSSCDLYLWTRRKQSSAPCLPWRVLGMPQPRCHLKSFVHSGLPSESGQAMLQQRDQVHLPVVCHQAKHPSAAHDPEVALPPSPGCLAGLSLLPSVSEQALHPGWGLHPCLKKASWQKANPFTAVLQTAKALGCLVYFGGRCLMLYLSPQATAHSKRGENTPGDVGSRKWDSGLLTHL